MPGSKTVLLSKRGWTGESTKVSGTSADCFRAMYYQKTASVLMLEYRPSTGNLLKNFLPFGYGIAADSQFS